MGKKGESLAFGGQALIEGVMIRGKQHLVMCVRQPSGEILTETMEINSLTQRHRLLGLPFIRGIIALGETMYMGVKGIAFSANAALEEEEEEFTWKEWAIVIVLTAAMSSLFFVIPFLVTTYLNLTGVLFNLVEAAVRLALFLGYMAVISLWGEFRRVLQYHGAEHKTINAHEHGVELTVDGVRGHSRLHRRCGTSFIFIVIIVSVLLFSVLPRTGFWPRLASRVVLIPVLGAISYELLRFSARHDDNIVIRALTAPGVFFQHLTTKEPEDPMLEVAIEAVNEVVKLSQT